MASFSLSFARTVLATVLTGLIVLAYEVYWLFGPGWTLRSAIETKERRMQAVRERMAGSNNPTLVTDLKDQEAALAKLVEGQETRRAAHLVAMQQKVNVWCASFMKTTYS